jgi:hypothetical protein
MLAIAVVGTVLAWGRRRRLARVAVPLLLALPVAGVGALPTLVAISDSAKLAAARSRPAYPMPELGAGVRARAAALLLVPWREGHPADGSWRWPFAAAAATVSIGAVPLALLAAARPRRRHLRLALSLAAVGAGAAVLLYQAPGAAEVLARAPVLGWMVWARAGFLLPLALAVGCALAADAWLRRPRPLHLAAAALAVQAAVALLAATAPVPGARSHVWRSAWLPGTLAAAAPLAAPAAGWVLPAAVAAGSLAQGAGLLPAATPAAPPPEALAAALRLVRSEPGRLLGLAEALPPNLAASFGLEDLRSHEPMRPHSLARLHHALGSAGDDLPGPVTRPWAGLAGAWGVRWLVTPPAGVPPGALAAGWEAAEAHAGWRFYRASRCLPVTRLATRAVAPPGDPGDGSWEAIDFADTAVLASPPTLGGHGSLDVVAARPALVVARVRADGPVLALHHAPLAAGWRATVDGRPAPLLQVNVAAMAVAVGAGEHEVRFTYVPAGLAAGTALTIAGLAGCAALAFARRRQWR